MPQSLIPVLVRRPQRHICRVAWAMLCLRHSLARATREGTVIDLGSGTSVQNNFLEALFPPLAQVPALSATAPDSEEQLLTEWGSLRVSDLTCFAWSMYRMLVRPIGYGPKRRTGHGIPWEWPRVPSPALFSSSSKNILYLFLCIDTHLSFSWG